MLERGIMGLGMGILLLIFFLLHKRWNAGAGSALAEGILSGTGLKEQSKWVWIVVATCLVLYVCVAYVISLAWLKGDDYIFIAVNDMGIKERLTFILGRYINWVSRTGDITCSLLGIAENRWQQVLLTPFFIILAPIALHSLVKSKGESIWSMKGWLTIVLTVPVMLLSTQMGEASPWRIFWCYAASVNYLWASVIICCLLTHYRGDKVYARKWMGLKCAGLFALGMYSGWSLECISVLLIPGLLIWYVLKMRRREHVQAPQFAGLLGCLSGAFMLFGSPALARRGASELARRALDPSSMSFSECFQFVTDHSAENMALLKGSTVQYLVDGLPVVLRPFYAPELLMNIWDCNKVVICILAGLLLCAMLKKQFHIIKRGLAGVGLGLLSAFSYLYSCIPSGMSFWPAGFIFIGTVVYLLLNVNLHKGAKTMFCALMMSMAVYICAPAVQEAQQYKEYEDARLTLIHELAARGVADICLEAPYPTAPQDKLGLIRCMDLTSDPKSYPNFIAKDYYKVNSISQKR